MVWSIKKRMLFALTGIIFVIQLILIIVATVLVDDFIIYRDVASLKSVLEDIDNQSDQLDHKMIEDLSRDIIGGMVFVVDENHSGDFLGNSDNENAPLFREFDVSSINDLGETLDLSDNRVDQIFSSDEITLVGRIDEGLLLVNIRNIEVIDDMKKVLHIYLGVATLGIMIILLIVINFYINYFEKKMTFEAQKEVLNSMGETTDSHFAETGEHIERVSQMMFKFSQKLGYSKDECEMLKIASTMHDIGKIAIPDNILKKPGKLSDEEFEIMKTHTSEGKKILGNSQLPILSMAKTIAVYHHERIDGKGYPRGLKGRNIPRCAKMMSIIDVYDALTNERVYKKAMSQEEAIEIIKKGKNTQFDGDLLGVFLKHMDEIVVMD